MKYRISPLWWPLLMILSPIIIPFLIMKKIRHEKNKERVIRINHQRIENAGLLELPEVDCLDLTVLVEWRAKESFLGDAAVSYFFETNRSSMLYDVGHGPQNRVFLNNAKLLNFDLNKPDALTISHLHKDHMGGMKAQRRKTVKVPEELLSVNKKKCFLPDRATADGLITEQIESPGLLTEDIATTGPLARSLFLMGYTEEQALVFNLKNKGLVIFTGCGHPTIEVILQMVKKISNLPIYAVGGGLHFPITEGRGNKAGIQLQKIAGTGKPPWASIGLQELQQTVNSINSVNPKKVYLSAHDSCDYALNYLKDKLRSQTTVLKAGQKYNI